VDYDSNRKVIATYQADPAGNLIRYEKGAPTSSSNIISAGTAKPFFYPPAAWHKGSNEVLLAAVTGAQEETSPPSGEISTMFMRSETSGVVNSDDFIECDVDDLCSLSTNCPDSVPASCVGPGPTAKPVGQPLILRNKVGSLQQYEAFWVYYEPSTSLCNVGDSWLIRISTKNGTQKLISAQKFAQTRATGMTVVGGGLDVIITAAGYGGKSASVQAALGNISSGSTLDDMPYVEVWKEVK